jgi:hypothetical protein
MLLSAPQVLSGRKCDRPRSARSGPCQSVRLSARAARLVICLEPQKLMGAVPRRASCLHEAWLRRTVSRSKTPPAAHDPCEGTLPFQPRSTHQPSGGRPCSGTSSMRASARAVGVEKSRRGVGLRQRVFVAETSACQHPCNARPPMSSNSVACKVESSSRSCGLSTKRLHPARAPNRRCPTNPPSGAGSAGGGVAVTISLPERGGLQSSGLAADAGVTKMCNPAVDAGVEPHLERSLYPSREQD